MGRATKSSARPRCFAAVRLAALTGASVLLAACNELRPRAASHLADAPELDAADGRSGRPATVGRSDGDARHSLPRWPIENGCARTWAASPEDAGPVGDLLLLASMCAPGLNPLRPAPFEARFEASERVVIVPLPFDSPRACFRALAVSSVDGIELSIARGNEMISGAYGSGKVVAVPADGPVCLRDTQGLQLVLRSTGDRSRTTPVARVVTNVWFARGE